MEEMVFPDDLYFLPTGEEKNFLLSKPYSHVWFSAQDTLEVFSQSFPQWAGIRIPLSAKSTRLTHFQRRCFSEQKSERFTTQPHYQK
jgi:hypothetical protein